MNLLSLGFTPNVAAVVDQQGAVMITTSHLAEGLKTVSHRSRGQIIGRLRTQTETQTGIAEQMVLTWTAAAGECVSAADVCVSGAGLG